MTKYQKLFQEMVEYNEDLFKNFKELSQKYEIAPHAIKSEFDTEGEKVLRIVRRYENILCSKSEGGKYGKFSGNLADKFWQSVRAYFPKIDLIGMK